MANIAVVGAGIFGCISAIKLAEAGHAVSLYEENSDIMQRASKCNQYRLHRGYHYPRSMDTAIRSISGARSFKKEYGSCLLSHWIKHYYALSNDSKVSTYDYLKFLQGMALEYEIVGFDECSKFLDVDSVQAVFKVVEDTIDIGQLKNKIFQQLHLSGVILHTSTKFIPYWIQNYEVVINATYSQYNSLVPVDQRIDYQFEVCEKPIVTLNDTFKNMSVAVIDGEFGCIDPYAPMNCHVLGHVKHAVHATNAGKFPDASSKFGKYLDSAAMWKHPNSNVELFVESLRRFFPSIVDGFYYHGSMWTIRVVLPDRRYDDACSSYITKHSDHLYSIISGEISTAVDIANDLVKLIEK